MGGDASPSDASPPMCQLRHRVDLVLLSRPLTVDERYRRAAELAASWRWSLKTDEALLPRHVPASRDHSLAVCRLFEQRAAKASKGSPRVPARLDSSQSV